MPGQMRILDTAQIALREVDQKMRCKISILDCGRRIANIGAPTPGGQQTGPRLWWTAGGGKLTYAKQHWTPLLSVLFWKWERGLAKDVAPAFWHAYVGVAEPQFVIDRFPFSNALDR